MGKKYYGKQKGIRWDLILFGIGAALFIVYGVLQIKNIKDRQDYERTIVRFEDLKEYSIEPTSGESTEPSEKDSVEVSYQKLFDANEDMIGWLKIPETEIEQRILSKFDLRPAAIIKYLNLRTPIYAKTTNYGHFGKENCGLKWEETVNL